MAAATKKRKRAKAKKPAKKAKSKAAKKRPAKKPKRSTAHKFGERRSLGVYDEAATRLARCKSANEMLAVLTYFKSDKVKAFRDRLTEGQPTGPWRMHLGNHLRALVRKREVEKLRKNGKLPGTKKKTTKRPKAKPKAKKKAKRKAARKPKRKAAKKR